MKVKLPTGLIYHELCHYMRADHIQERPIIAQMLWEKIKVGEGKIIDLYEDELKQYRHELENMLDIKQDHICSGSDWTYLMQHALAKRIESLS